LELITYSGWDEGRDVLQTNDGGYILTGRSDQGPMKMVLSKVNGSGNEQWYHFYSNCECGLAIRPAVGGGYIVAGYTDSGAVLLKVDLSGNEEWCCSYAGFCSFANSVEVIPENGYVITGRCDISQPYCDVSLIRTNDVGDTIWTKRMGGPLNDVGRSVILSSDGCCVIAGLTNSFGAGSNDFYVIKTEMVSSVANLTPCMAPSQFTLYNAYPNPFNQRTVIKYDVSRLSKVDLNIYDVMGKRTATLVNKFNGPGSYEATWEAGDLPSGIYFVRMTAGDFHQTRKVVLLK
jgi:hypothetical protein